MQNNKVLLSEIGFFREEKKEGKLSIFRDYSAIVYQVSELISYGVSEIAINALCDKDDILKSIPDGFKKRIIFVDQKDEARKKSEIILHPIAVELSIEFKDLNSFSFSEGTFFHDEFTILFTNIRDFFIGIEEQLLIDIDLVAMRNAVFTLRNNLKSSDSMQSLAMLSGLLGSYEETSIDSITLIPTASGELVELFNRFLEDELYKELSQENHNLGIQNKIVRSKTIISRLTKDILKKPFAKEIVDLSAKGLTVASGSPMPSSKTFDSLFSSIYLPPVAPIKPMLTIAKEKWKKANPEIILPKWDFSS